jgi:hypothetical protein
MPQDAVNRVNRTQARAGKHRYQSFRDHRQVDHDAIAFFDTVVFQHAGAAGDFVA